MSQKVSRKTAVGEDKEKGQTDSPVKEMKKKMAANAEKEKQAAEKSEKVEKPTEKPTEKPEKTDKSDKSEKKEKHTDKKDQQAEKSKEDGSNKEDKNAKPEKDKPTPSKEPSKAKQNGQRVHNGVSDVTLGTNGSDDVINGTVSAESEDDDVMLVIDDHDELFPELTYDDTSDVDFEPPTPEATSRSLTRRSQVKATRTPETPRPASDKLADKDADYDPSKDSKLLKLKDDAPPTDRKLRSSDSPKPEGKKEIEAKKELEAKKETEAKKDEAKKDKKDKTESPRKAQDKDTIVEVVEDNEESKEKEEEKTNEEVQSQESDKVDIEVIVEVEGSEGADEARKTDTNYSKSRVKVSPYRRSMRLADQTNTSLQANYTGNNTTMEMDITESSSFIDDAALDDSSYLRGLRSIRGRASYKPLKEMSLRHVSANRSVRSSTSTTVPSPGLEAHGRPTAPVVGRKRKPDTHGPEAEGSLAQEATYLARKRVRVLERLAQPFRRVAAAAALPVASRRNAEIVGINTDLPLTAPTVSAESFDPESLKPAPEPPVAVPLAAPHERDSKRCAIM